MEFYLLDIVPCMSDLLTLADIVKTYGGNGAPEITVLKGVSLSVEMGDFVAIMGQSGSGKSTLMNIIGLLDIPTSGTYHLDGKDVSRLTEDAQATMRSLTIGFVFQSYNLLPRLSALEQVMLPLRYQGVPHKEMVARAKEALERVGLQGREHNTPAQLSGGQMQRVAIARALSTGARLILADEPTGALDSQTGKEVMQLMQKLNAEGATIVLITHDSGIASYARRTIRISDGNILKSDAPDPHYS